MLTQHLSRYGIRVNLRESERKRKTTEPAPEPEDAEDSRQGAVPADAVDPDLDTEIT